CLAIEGQKAGITVNVLAPNAYSRMTASLFPEGSEDRFAPERVSPAIAWLCSDEAAEITGRQFVISGNRVSLLYPAAMQISDSEAGADAYTPSEIGQKIKDSMADWPKAATVPELIF
ncbi:MAG: hypothetical protein ACR2PQ_11240, partial [Myxococcota bacterium]